MSYCEIGQTARVTFPDGSVQEFDDTPITISCKEWYEQCINLDVVVYYTYTYTYPSGYTVTRSANTSQSSGKNPKLPIGGIRGIVVTEGDIRRGEVQILHRDSAESNAGSCTPNWYKYHGLFHVESITAVITDIQPKYPPAPIDTTGKVLIIIGNSGAELFTGSFDDCNYSVECIDAGCPPGTLECNGCCLNCNKTLASLLEIKSLLITKLSR